MSEAYIVAAARTPIGKFGGALKDLSPADLGAIAPLGPIDRTIMLPWGYAKAPDDLSIRRNYHLVLRACAGMGMIAGRGVSWR